jgi:outer membrane immunogenic protein
MRQKFLSAAAVIAIVTAVGGPVSAADLMPLKAPPPMAPSCMWCGFYVGGHVGYGWSKYDGQLNSDTAGIPPLNFSDFQANGLALGMHAGYNFQSGSWVFGIEGDTTITPGWQDKLTGINSGVNFVPGGDGSLSASTRIDWLASIRGRLGMAFDRTLLYATGGVAWVHGTHTFGSSSPAQDSKFNFTKVGFVVGGGVEWKYTNSVSLRLEGLHYIFNQNTALVNIGDGNGVADNMNFKTISVVRAGVSWYLN